MATHSVAARAKGSSQSASEGEVKMIIFVN